MFGKLYSQPSSSQQTLLPSLQGSVSHSVQKWKSTDGGKQKQITDAVVNFIASDLQPLSVVESSAFRKILEMAEPRYLMPSRKYLSATLIPTHFSESFSRVVKLLHCASRVCLTLDIWTNRQAPSYLGVTAHFIIDFNLSSVMLACRRFWGSHTGEAILLHFAEIEQLFSISGKIDNIITDNAANMLKAFRLLEISHDEDDATDSDFNEDDDDVQPVEIDAELQSELDVIQPNHFSCFAHTLQLVVKDGMDKADQVKRVLGKVARLVSHVRHLTSASDLFVDVNRLQSANVTRWNSQLTMLKSLLKVYDSPPMQALDYGGKLNLYEINIVKDIVEILTPF